MRRSKPGNNNRDTLQRLGRRLLAFLVRDVADGSLRVDRLVVGQLPPAAQQALGSETSEVVVDVSFAQHQRDSHPEVPLAAYAMLPAMLAHPTVILQHGNRRLLLLKRSGQIYALALKTTLDGRENWAASFWIENIRGVRRQLKRDHLVFGNTEDLEK
jgi:hypothetical protein